MNRHRFVPLALLLVFCVLLNSPVTASTSQSVFVEKDDTPLFSEGNWAFADLAEYPVTINNLEDFIDQLSDLHNESDIGTHSNPAAMQALDGIYNTLTSDNVTIPEQLIEDPLNETPPYNQSTYESWRLDLEGGWTDVDYNEISAELCVYAGLQAVEALRVDIWDNDGWVNIISNIAEGWNNVSISPSLIDKNLEMRFTGSDTGNTSIQNSWDIDAVLLHTWTVMYGSKLTQNGIIQDLGNNLSRYIGSVGEMNTWDDTSDTWYRYLYDPEEKTVQIGNLTITHLPGGDLSIDGDAGSRVGKLSWFIQAYYNDQWNNITLDNYQFAGFTKTADNVTAHQRFWGTQGEMNVYLTYSYFGGFKTRVDIRNDAAQAVPIRAIWAARNVSGLQDNYQLLRNEDDIVYGIQIEDAVFSWNDVIVSDNPLSTQTVIDKPARRAAVIFGNQSTIIPAGYTATIDPDYSMTSDAYDNYWNYWADPTDTDVDNADANKIETDGSSFTYASLFAAPVDIVPYSVVTAATLTVYVISESGANTVNIQRIDSSNVPALDDNVNGNGGSPPTIDTTPTGTLLIGATGPTTSQDIGKLVQESINEAGWAANNRMGFRLMPDAVCAHTIEDYQRATSNHAKITITYVAPSANWLAGYGYRQGHSIDGKTGAGTDYQTMVLVEYGSGTSADGTIYANEHCDTDFDDIRFTDNDGETQLDYWMEEKTDSDDATFWVEVSDDLGSDQAIYVYYGKSGDSTTSDGEATFLFFDDFNDNSFDTAKWTCSNGVEGTDWAEQNSRLELEPGTDRPWIYSDTSWGGGISYRSYVYFQDYRSNGLIEQIGGTPQYAGDLAIFRDFSTTEGADIEDEGVASMPSFAQTENTWQTHEVLWYSGSHVELNINDVEKHDETTNSPDGTPAIPIFLYVYHLDTNPKLYLDWVFVRTLTSGAEPAHYTWTVEHEPPTYAPVNDVAPECTNMDDSDHLYARNRQYEFSLSVTDADGWEDITYIELSSYDHDTTTLRWTVRYTQDGRGVSEPAGDSYIAASLKSYSESGDNLDVEIYLYIEWTHPDSDDDDLYQYVLDDNSKSDEDSYPTTNYNYETRVDFAPDPSLSDGIGTVDRGNFSTVGSITASAKCEYFLSASDLHPPADEIDVWVTCPDTPDPDWHATNYEDTGGTFSVLVDSDNVVGLDTYTFKVVANGAGSGGTSHATGTQTATYIADRIHVVGYFWPTDTNASLNQDVTITVQLSYAYSGVPQDGSITVNGVSATFWEIAKWNFTDSESTVTLNTYDTVAASGNVHGITAVEQFGNSIQVLWDRINITMTSNLDWTIIDHNTTLTATGEYEYSGDPWSGVITWADRFPSESTVGTYDYGASMITSITDPTYNITVFAAGEEATVIFDDMIPSGAVAHIWVQYSSTKVYLFWGVASNWMWDYNDTLLEVDVVLHAYSNGSSPEAIGGTYGSGAFGGLTLGHYNPDWHYVSLTVNCEMSHSGIDYDWQVWGQVLEVDILHSIQITDSIIYLTDDYVTFGIVTNWNNGSFTIWDNTTKVGYSLEGWHQIEKSSVVGLHNLTILVNGTYGYADGVGQTRDFSESDSWTWLNFKYTVTEPDAYDCHIVILDNLYELIAFDTFEVYNNDSRIYHDTIQVTDGYAYKITIKNRFGDTVNETTFDADFEMIVFVDTYSFKFMNWYNGFLRVNVTRGGLTYSEIIMPMEIIEFNLFEATYTFSVDFLNGTTKFEQEIEVTNSTGYVITGDSLTDVFDLVNSVWDMTTSINITVTSTNNYALTISIDLININTTIGYQLVQVLLNITNTNTTIYSQVVDLLAYLQNVNSTLFDQTVDIIIELNYISSNVTAGFISVAATLSAIDSNLYSNFTSVAATLVMLDSSLLSNFTEISATLLAIDSSLLSNFTYVMANLTGIGSNITANYLSVSAALSAIDSSLLSNFTSVSAYLTMIDSSLLSNFTAVTSTLTTIGSNITSNYLSVSATLSMIDSSLLSNFTDLTAELLLVNSSLATQFLSVSATLSMLDSSLLSNFTAVTATLSMIDSSLLSNFTSVTSILSAIGSNVTSNYLSVVATLSAIDSSLLSNFTAVTATLSMLDSQLLSNFTELTAELLAVNSTIASQVVSIAATLSMLDSSLLSNFTEISATLLMIDSSLLSNFTSVTSTLAALGSNVTSNYLSVAAALVLIDSNLYSNFTSITSTLTAMGSNITTNYLAITAELALIDSSLAANFTTMMTKLIATNSSLFIQTLAIISDLEFLNATMYLVDDPTHLNPLVLGHSYSDVYCDLTIVTNWHNASISVYDNDLLRTGPTSELLCPIRYPLLATSGTHNLSIFVDGSNDSFWYNISYTVAEIISFELEDWDVTPQLGVENYLECFFRTTWGNSTIYVYLNDSLQTSILEQEGGISFGFWMSGISGLHNYVFNVTSGANVITITWDYYLPDWAETALVMRWDLWTFQDNYTMMALESNWMNCTYYVYLNGSLVATSYNDPVTLNFTRDMNEGTYNLTIHAYGGSQNYTVKNIRYIVTEEGVSYDFSTVTGGVTYAYGDTYEGDVTIHENPPGWFMDQGTAAIIAVGGFLVIFTAFLVARELKQRDRENREAQYSQ